MAEVETWGEILAAISDRNAEGPFAITTDCRSIRTNDRSARNAVFRFAIIRLKRWPCHAFGTSSALDLSAAPHAFGPKVVYRSKINNHTAY